MITLEQLHARFAKDGWYNIHYDMAQIIVNNRGEVDVEDGVARVNSRIPNVGMLATKDGVVRFDDIDKLFVVLDAIWPRRDEFESINFTTAKHVKDLMWFEGPLLSHYKFDGKDYLVKWVDVTDVAHIWLVYEVTPEHLADYLNQRITLATVEAMAPSFYRLVGPINQVSSTLLASLSYEELQIYHDQWMAPEEVSIYDPSLGPNEFFLGNVPHDKPIEK